MSDSPKPLSFTDGMYSFELPERRDAVIAPGVNADFARSQYAQVGDGIFDIPRKAALESLILSMANLARLSGGEPGSSGVAVVHGSCGPDASCIIMVERKHEGESEFSPAPDCGFFDGDGTGASREGDMDRIVVCAPVFGKGSVDAAFLPTNSAVPVVVGEPYKSGDLRANAAAYAAAMLDFAEFCSKDVMSIPRARVTEFDGSNITLAADLADDAGEVRSCIVGPMSVDATLSDEVQVRDAKDASVDAISIPLGLVRERGCATVLAKGLDLEADPTAVSHISSFSQNMPSADCDGKEIPLSEVESLCTFRDKSGQVWHMGAFGDDGVIGVETSPDMLEVALSCDTLFKVPEPGSAEGTLADFASSGQLFSSVFSSAVSLDAFAVPNKSRMYVADKIAYDTVVATASGMLMDVRVSGLKPGSELSDTVRIAWGETPGHEEGSREMPLSKVVETASRAEQMLATGEYVRDEEGDYHHAVSDGRTMSEKFVEDESRGREHDGNDGPR